MKLCDRTGKYHKFNMGSRNYLVSRVATTAVNMKSVVAEQERANCEAVLQESVIRHLCEPCELKIKKKYIKIRFQQYHRLEKIMIPPHLDSCPPPQPPPTPPYAEYLFKTN